MAPVSATAFSGPATWRASILILFAVGCAYANSLRGPFVFDDHRSIVENLSIRHLGGLHQVLSPPADAGVGGRPFANLSYALNYAVSGLGVWSYHALNILIHTAAALALFGVVRRVLHRPGLPERLGAVATPLALAAALLWCLHPLQTQAVSYLSQRTEVLMALCYLVTLYGFVRYLETPSPRWAAVTFLACLLGMASKEVMVTAPLLLLGFDRIFGATSWREVWRRRGRLHLGLAASWLLLAWLMFRSPIGQRGVGFDLGITGFDYALTQCRGLVRYLGLILWPNPLIFDRGTGILHHVIEIAPFAFVLAGFLAGTVQTFRTRPAVAFCAASFFVLLAPASSIVPIAGQPVAESRAYLPSAAALVLVVIGVHRLLGRRALPLLCVALVGLGFLTARRNHDYRSPVALWTDTVAKQPDNPRAHCYLGLALDQSGRSAEALPSLEKAVALAPTSNEARNALGNTLRRLNRLREAEPHLREAMRLNPRDVAAPTNLGATLTALGRFTEAAEILRATVAQHPGFALTHLYLGQAVRRSARPADAIVSFETALRLNPDFAAAHDALGSLLIQLGRPGEALRHVQAAVKLNPGDAASHNNLGSALFSLGRFKEAAAEYRAALRVQPEGFDAQHNLALALYKTEAYDEAVAEFHVALRLRPNHADAHANLGNALAQQGKLEAAKAEYETALRLKPDLAHVAANLAVVRTALAEQSAAKKP